MKTIAQFFNVKDFPFIIKDKNGNETYYENSDEYWSKKEYDSNGNKMYYENSNGEVVDNRPKGNCNGKVVEIDGKRYKLQEGKVRKGGHNTRPSANRPTITARAISRPSGNNSSSGKTSQKT